MVEETVRESLGSRTRRCETRVKAASAVLAAFACCGSVREFTRRAVAGGAAADADADADADVDAGAAGALWTAAASAAGRAAAGAASAADTAGASACCCCCPCCAAGGLCWNLHCSPLKHRPSRSSKQSCSSGSWSAGCSYLHGLRWSRRGQNFLSRQERHILSSGAAMLRGGSECPPRPAAP